MGKQTKSEINLEHLTSISNYIFETMNLAPHSRAPFVGKSAFAHKGGIHVSSVLKDSRMYEHISPDKVGNVQRVIVSDLSGQSNIRYKAKELGFELPDNTVFSKKRGESHKKHKHYSNTINMFTNGVRCYCK